MGHVFTQPLAISSDLSGWVARARGELGADTRVFAAVADPDAAGVNAAKSPDRLIILLGNEGRGLTPELLSHADMRVTIPIDRAADSLNVAAATAVLLHVLRPVSPGIRPQNTPA
jgi:tRNA G18 (ribose-2'-O)-methylase SpoU